MPIPFYKYQGTGNDFVMIDNRQSIVSKNNTKLIKTLCDRKFGIGADGLILLENHTELDFTMVYYNADGNPSSMCGNGGRCTVAFAKHLGIIQNQALFEAVDGSHEAFIKNDQIHLKMSDVTHIEEHSNHVFIDTGSPHHVQWVENLENFNVKQEGAAIRYGSLYGREGSNINFVEKTSNGYVMRTYERGVEDETLSCGTGATAVALALHKQGKIQDTRVDLKVSGGRLEVAFNPNGESYDMIFLIGPAKLVYTGVWPD